MRHAVRGALATAMTVALCGAASAQNSYYSYGQPQQTLPAFGGQGVIAPAATSTYQGPTTAQPTTGGSTLYPSATTYAPTAPAATGYTPSTSTYAPQQVGTSYATSPAPVSQGTAATTLPTQSYTGATPSYPTATAPTTPYITPSYGSAPATTGYQPTQPSYQPAQTATLPTYGTPTTLPAPLPNYGTPTTLPGAGYGTATLPTPGYGTTPTAPTTPAQTEVADTDAWTYNLARFYPAVQACLRRSTVKNPVIANVQERDNKTMMLIGEGGSSNYSTCSTGLTGTQVKANSDVRNLPPAFYAPIGSTFTVSPDRPFQPIVDTNQKVIGWMVRTQPANPAYGQFGQARSFDGQFIPPMMVNTSVGKS